MSDMVRIRFEGEIMLDMLELESVHGDAVQAAQNALGFSGATIRDAEVDDFLMGESDDEEELELRDDLTADDVDYEWPAT